MVTFLLSLTLSGWRRLRWCFQTARSTNIQYCGHSIRNNTVCFFCLPSSKVPAPIPWFVFKELAYRKEKLSGQLINKKIGIK